MNGKKDKCQMPKCYPWLTLVCGISFDSPISSKSSTLNITFVSRKTHTTSPGMRLSRSCYYHFISFLSFNSKLLNSLHPLFIFLPQSLLKCLHFGLSSHHLLKLFSPRSSMTSLLLIYWTFSVLIWPALVVWLDLILYCGSFCSSLSSFISWVLWPHTFPRLLATRDNWKGRQTWVWILALPLSA